MVRIASIAAVLPEHVHAQREIRRRSRPLLTATRDAVADDPTGCTPPRASRRATTRSRWRSTPALTTFTAANDAFLRVGTDLAADACRRALAEAGLTATDVDYLLFTSVTGIGAPSIDVLLADRLGMRSDVKHVPVFGLGCVGGAAGIARVRDYLQGHPHDVALLVSVELCSLTLQQGDDSMANIVSSGLFGDGASAVVMVGGDRRGEARAGSRSSTPAARSTRTPSTRSAGTSAAAASGSSWRRAWRTSSRSTSARDVVDLLAAHGLKVSDVGTWVAHTGGPRILAGRGARARAARRGVRGELGVAGAGRATSARRASCTCWPTSSPPGGQIPGSAGVLFAFGPGVCAETVLLRWPEEP